MAIKLSSLNIGDIIKFRVNGTPTEFIVVHQGLPSANYDSSCNGTWFLSKYFVSSGAFSTNGSNSLSASSGHTYLNTTAYNTLDADIKSAIREVKIPYQNGTGTAGSVAVGANGLTTRIFLPSSTELGCTAANFAYGTPKEIGAVLSYFSGATNATRMATYPDGTAGTWWTRTPDSTSTTKQLIINTNGAGHSFNCSTSNGVRPMFIIPGDKEIELNDDDSYSIVVSKLGDIAEGSKVLLNENGTPTEFFVIRHDYQYDLNGRGRTLLMRVKCPNDSTMAWGSGYNYQASKVDTWLNDTYKYRLDSNIITLMGQTIIKTKTSYNSSITQISRSCFLLSSTEYALTTGEGDQLTEASTKKVTTLDSGSTCYLWTRTPASSSAITTLHYTTGGSWTTGPTETYPAVRPAFTLPENIKFSKNDDGTYSMITVTPISNLSGDTTTYNFIISIESTGTQWIDTGFIPNQDTRIDIDFEAISVGNLGEKGGGSAPYGAATDYNKNAFECYTQSAKYEFNYNTSYDFIGNATESGKRIKVSHDKNVITLKDSDGTEYTKTFTYGAFTAPYTLYLFASHRATILPGLTKIYSCKIYDNGTLIRDFVPCLKNGEEAGLYDKVEGKFYSNAGTGEFLWYDECNRDNVDQKNMLPKAIDENGNIYNGIGYGPANSAFVEEGYFTTGFIPVTYGDEIYLRNTLLGNDEFLDRGMVVYYDSNFQYINQISGGGLPVAMNCICNTNEEITQFTIMNPVDDDIYVMDITNVAYIKIETCHLGPDSIITVNVPIKLSEQKILQYIGATGTQYINTEFIPNNNTRLVADMNLKNTTTTLRALLGSRTAFQNEAFAMFASNSKFQNDFGNVYADVTMTTTGRHTIDKNKNLLYVDGTLKYTLTNNTFTGTYPMYLFQINNGGTAMTSYPMVANLYSCQIYDYGPLAKDFIPAQTEDGTVCLYEKISGKYHKNIGTGTFTAGPETGVIMNPLMDDLKCVLIDGIPQLSYYSYSSVNSYIIERSVNNEEFEAIETKTAKTVDSCNYTDEDLGNANSVQYRVKAISGDYESEYLYTDIYSLYKISTYTNLIVGGVL